MYTYNQHDLSGSVGLVLFRTLVGCHRYVSFVGTIVGTTGFWVGVSAGSVSIILVAVCYFFARITFFASDFA